MIKKLCFKMINNPKMKFWAKRSALVIQKAFPSAHDKMKNYIRSVIYQEGYLKKSKDAFGGEKYIWGMKSVEVKFKAPLISVIVPNYNHAVYLEQRLESIYHQDYSNFEVILLDDCSNDNSVEILKKYKEKYSDITTLHINNLNSGGVFKQWDKGISLASGEYVWIAESDDYCETNFLSTMAPLFYDESVMLAFCRSTFVQNGKDIYTTEEYLQEIDCFDWVKPFVATANNVVANGWALKNIIPNVSSVLFRNTGKFPADFVSMWNNLKLCGDWLFYLALIKGGTIAYTNVVTNNYRIHSESTSLKIQSTSRYYQEFEIIASYIACNYKISPEIFYKQKQALQQHYMHLNENVSVTDIDQWYRLDIIKAKMKQRKPNIMIAGFSMVMGGGETFPIMLANALKEKGIAVTFFDFEMDKSDPIVRNMLYKEIPLVKVSRLSSLADAVNKMGIDVMHSHHACVDEVLSQLLILNTELETKQVITLHGMYEAINYRDFDRLLSNTSQTCSRYIYTADKNLNIFKGRKEKELLEFTKISNGLPEFKVSPIDRKSLEIGEDAFVLCLVSRGIQEKGWKEAVEAVKLARLRSHRDIQLLLIGDGEMYSKLAKEHFDFVHLLGVKSNIRDYFACSDMGFLPSRFKGESFPLVVIDSLFSGKPVLATNIGEIKYQLTGQDGVIAGALLDLCDWEIPIDRLAELIAVYAKKGEEYKLACEAVESAKMKFDICKIADQYINVYEKVAEM